MGNGVHRLIAIGGVIFWAALLMLGGCGAQSGVSGGAFAVEPDPALPLMAAYELEGRDRPVIFMELPDGQQDRFDEVAGQLAAELGAEVLPADTAFRGDLDLPALTPIDPDTGQVGVSLTLDGMFPIEDGRYEATVRYARSGLDGGGITFVLEQQEADWVIVERFPDDQA